MKITKISLNMKKINWLGTEKNITERKNVLLYLQESTLI